MNQPTFLFWQRWLLAVSVLQIFVGLLIALAPDSVLFAAHTRALAATWFDGGLTDDATALRRFFFGIIGGTIAGYFLLQTLIVWIPFRRRERWAWHAVLWALLLWFTVDSTMSVRHGALFNVWMINIWPAVLTAVPLAMTRRAFARGPS
ncbi:MAG: hypothetical protein JJU00_05420 [Opitutales bacterium]|nr:hypothetical protein [Opitutales bacterium]